MQQQMMEQQQLDAQDTGYDPGEQMQQMSQQYSSPPRHHDWTPLEDDYNMVDETSIPRDFYIDKPVSTVSSWD